MDDNIPPEVQYKALYNGLDEFEIKSAFSMAGRQIEQDVFSVFSSGRASSKYATDYAAIITDDFTNGEPSVRWAEADRPLGVNSCCGSD